MIYDIGIKVTITNTNPRSNKSTLYGHTCRIKRRYERNRYDSYAMDTYSYAYDIEWCPEDSPGRRWILTLVLFCGLSTTLFLIGLLLVLLLILEVCPTFRNRKELFYGLLCRSAGYDASL